jgi:glycosyltransferase involved in cell wall biosynthesis
MLTASRPETTPLLPADFTLLQITPELETGGAEQTTLDVAAAVARIGRRAIVASHGGRMAGAVEAGGGELKLMPVQSKNPLVMLGNAARLIDLIRKEKVSLVHVRSRAPAFSALWAAHAARVPLVATYHGVYNARTSLKRWYNAVMTRGDMVIANSEFTRDHVLLEHGLDPEKVVAIPRGIDLVRFDPAAVEPERVTRLLNAWGVDPDDPRPRILLAGRLTRWKGQLLLIEAAARLKLRGNKDFLIILAGDDQGRDAYRAEIDASIARNSLHKNVRIVGHCDDMPAAYLACDAAAAPSLEPEAFGRTAVEPQVMGRPVLAADHGATRETVVPGQTGWLIEPGDAKAWATALGEAVLASKGRRQAMGRAGQERARRLYSVETMCAATLAVYERVLERRLNAVK